MATAVFESTWLQLYAPQNLLERYRVLDQPDDATLDVDWVMGAALMARREAFESVRAELDTRLDALTSAADGALGAPAERPRR